MVHGDQQHVFIVAQCDQATPDQRAPREIEVGSYLGGGESLGFAHRVRIVAQIVLHQRKADVGRSDVLYRLAVLQHEARAQRLMPRHDACQRTAQSGRIQAARQVQAQRDVVSAALPFQLCQKPQACLGERER